MEERRYTAEIVIPATKWDAGDITEIGGFRLRIEERNGPAAGTWTVGENGIVRIRQTSGPHYVLTILATREDSCACGRLHLVGDTLTMGCEIFDERAVPCQTTS